MTTHSSIPAWKILWIGYSSVGYNPQSHKESDTTEVTEHTGNSFIYSSVNEHLDCVQCLAIMNNATCKHSRVGFCAKRNFHFSGDDTSKWDY